MLPLPPPVPRVSARWIPKQSLPLGPSEPIESCPTTPNPCPKEPLAELESILKSHRQLPYPEAQLARDRRLAALGSCREFPPGYLENLRSELAPQCTEALYLHVVSAELRGPQRAELEGRVLAVRIQSLQLNAPNISEEESADSSLKKLRAELVPWLEKQLTQTGSLAQSIIALPETTGRTLALYYLTERLHRIEQLTHRFGQALRKDNTLVFEAEKELSTASSTTDVTLGELLNTLELELADSAAGEGALNSRVARRLRVHWQPRGGFQRAKLLRAAVHDDDSVGGLSDLLPLPHFSEILPIENQLDAFLNSPSRGLSPAQLSVLHQKAMTCTDAQTSETDPACRLEKELGRHYLSLALLFASNRHAQLAEAMLRSARSRSPSGRLRDDLELDFAIAEALIALSAGNPKIEPSLKRFANEASDPVLRAYGNINSALAAGAPPPAQDYAHLKPHELACFQEEDVHLDLKLSVHCMPFSWLGEPHLPQLPE